MPATIHSVADPDGVHAPPPPPIKTRARSQWGTIANPHAKVFDPPAAPSPTLATEWKLFSICFLPFICENTHKVWYKNLWNWHINDIWPFDLAPRSPVWPYDENVTAILFCSSSPSTWYATWPCLKKKWPPGHPQHPKVPPLGHDPANRMKILSDMFVSFISENTQSLV